MSQLLDDAADDPLASDRDRPEPPRDPRWGRYLLAPEPGAAPVPHTRVSTVKALVGDGYQLQAWKARQVARGLAQRPGLVARMGSLPDPDGGPDDTARRAAIDALVDDAMQAAGASDAASAGTALHRMREDVETGRRTMGSVPEPWRAKVEAAQALIDGVGLQLVHVELVTSRTWQHDDTQTRVAGTCDRVYRVTRPLHAVGTTLLPGQLVIEDDKTGRTAGRLSEAAQLAAYACARWAHRHETGWYPEVMPDVSSHVGLILHWPAMTDEPPRLLGIDLRQGLAAFARALTRRIEDRASVAQHVIPAPGPQAWIDAIERCTTPEALGALGVAAAQEGMTDPAVIAAGRRRRAELSGTLTT